jgi:transglutaminase-like putative cysteine protease
MPLRYIQAIRKSIFTKGLAVFAALCVCVIIGWAVKIKILGNTPAANRFQSDYSLSRQIQYQFTLRNKTNRLVTNAEFWAHAPVKQTPTQRCSQIESSYPHELITDSFGNQILHYTFDEFPPYATRIVSVKTDLVLSNTPNPLAMPDLQIFLKPEKYIESDNPEIRRLAQTLKAATPLQTAENIFSWVAGNIRYAGYLPKARGALYALQNKKGDCTEFMYLFAALCRANNIPARGIGGYISTQNKILKPGDYHNWAEFYLDGTWRISDPQNKVFMKDQSNYIAMRLISASTDSSIEPFNKFRLEGAGLQVKMNL